MKAAAYARVSTDKQSETSIETQFDDIVRYANLNNFELVGKYFDKESGSKINRENFDKIIEMASNKEIDAILVYKFDRFFRNAIEDMLITEKLAKLGVRVISALEPFMDVSTPQGFLMRWIGSGINDFNRRNLIQEIQAKTTKVAERGYWLGGIPPYGYLTKHIKDHEGRKRAVLDIHPEESEVVKLIFSMYLDNFGFKEIAKKLDEVGAKPRNNDFWSHTTIRDIVTNSKYTGIYIWRKGKKHNSHARRDDMIVIENAIPVIIDIETWQKAQAKYNEKTFEKERRFNYLLSGMCICGECGKIMKNRSSTGRNNKLVGYYRCKDHVTIKAENIENFVLDYISRKIFGDISDFKTLAEKINLEWSKNNQFVTEKRAGLIKELAEINKKISNYVDLAGLADDLTEIQEKLKELKARRDRINYDLENLLVKTEIIDEENLRKRWEDLKEAMKNNPQTTLKHLIESITIYKSGYIEIKQKEFA